MQNSDVNAAFLLCFHLLQTVLVEDLQSIAYRMHVEVIDVFVWKKPPCSDRFEKRVMPFTFRKEGLDVLAIRLSIESSHFLQQR
jgi:hypothetical protein